MSDITVVIPTIKGREKLLDRALRSVEEETPFGWNTVIQLAEPGEGAAQTRNRALEKVTSKWVAFLDDDDEFKPEHIIKCFQHAKRTDADIVYPWFDISRGGKIRNDLDPLFINGKPAFGQAFDPEALTKNNFIPVTVLARVAMIRGVGGFPVPGSEAWPHPDCEDWGLWLALRDAGARFSHLPERTWTWHWHGKNTSGRPDAAEKIYTEG
jgi:hypothetical protein